mgnify:CR=1 FL=1
MGADNFRATRDTAVFKKNVERFDFILDTVSAPHDYIAYLGLLRLDVTMVRVGTPAPTSPGAVHTTKRGGGPAEQGEQCL